MARSGSDPFVERVREATDIVEVVGAHVALKKAGARLGGLCPFHQEKTASFYVNPSLQAFHCFGCGVGGDVFSFVMQYEKMTFPEALRHLAERAGIPLPDRRGPATDTLERIREALRVARLWYRRRLEGPDGAAGRAYLDARGIRPETREAYGLGLAPDAWDGLVRHAKPIVSERALIEAGLAAESDSGRVYDRFRNRLIIPLESPGGSPVGFGGRALGDTEPKYLNSPETAVYRKGSLLYGVGPARQGIRDEGRIVVVEGYFDVIALAQAGVGGIVGTCGTALTPEQGTLLKRLADRVVLLFDGDKAGLRAALRAIPILAGEIPELVIARPPSGIDPDLWIRRDGAEAVRAALSRAPGPLRFLEELVGEGVLTVRDAAGRAVEAMAALQDPLTRDLWVQEAASRFGIRAEAFLQALARSDGKRPPAPEAAPSPRKDPLKWGAFEKECLRSALAHPTKAGEIAAAVEETGGADARLPEFLRWIALQAEDPDCRNTAALLSRAARDHPEEGLWTSLTLSEGAEPAAPEALLRSLRLRAIRRRMDEVDACIRRAEESGNQDDLIRYLTERQGLSRERALLASDHAGMAGGGGGNEA